MRRAWVVAGVIGMAAAFSHPAAAQDRLPRDARLYRGQRLVAAGCYYRLDMQWDGNLVAYDGSGRVVWATNTSTGAWLTVQGDVNTVLYTGNYAVWATGICGGGPGVIGCIPEGPYLVMQDDGNIVVYDGNGQFGPTWVAWASNTSTGEPLGQTPCPYQASYTRVWEGFEYVGTPIWSAETNPFGHSVCAEWCGADPTCLGWTWDGGVSTMCHAFSSWSGSTPFPGVTSGRVYREFCSRSSSDTCDAQGATCERMNGHDVCRWDSAQTESDCAGTVGIWTAANSGFAQNTPGSVPPGADGSCITQIENLSCSSSDRALCVSRGATCERAHSTNGGRRDLCRWHDARNPSACTPPGIWTSADSSFAIGWPTAVPDGWTGACITQVQNLY